MPADLRYNPTTMNEARLFIDQLVDGQAVDQVFLVRDKDLRTTKRGDLYICSTLVDKTGSVPSRMWQATESIYAAIPVEGFLHVKGRVEDYRGTPQLIIDACRPFPSDKVDLADFLAASARDVDEMWQELLEILRSVKDKQLRLLIKKFVEDHDLVARFKRSPAAMQMHHPFIGGLLEHTLNIARAASALLPLYPNINADLVLVGAFLHDVGKTAELTSSTSISYTDRGMLVGHITMAAIWIQEKADAVAAETGEPFDATTLDLLQHLILAHHGEHEYGSPKLPMIPEAFFLHHLDNLDAKVWMTTQAVEADPDEQASFTRYIPSLQVRIFKNSRPEDE
jgi:3'-5' exoribonuclease